MKHRWFAGVASGLARFIGLDIFPVRMIIRFLFLAFPPTTWFIYLILAIMLPKQKLYDEEYRRKYAKDFYKELEREREATYKKYKREYKEAKRELKNDYKTYTKDSKESRKPIYKPQVKVDIQRLDFEDIIERSEGKVSNRVFSKITTIDEKVRVLMPKLSRWRTMFDSDLSTVKRAALEYFPQAVQHYLSLPRDYAEHHLLATGETPEQKLLSDLNTLEHTLDNVIESQYQDQKVQIPDDLKKLNERFSTPEPQSDDIGRNLDNLMNRIRGKVSSDVYEKVESIRTSILSVLPHLAELGAGMTQEAYNIRHTALEYLPDALDKYMTLPEGFAESHDLGNGKTAKDILLEQLDILDDTMKDMIGDVYQEDAQALLIHGRFLKEKFADQKFTLPSQEEKQAYKAKEELRFPDLNKVEQEVKIQN